MSKTPRPMPTQPVKRPDWLAALDKELGAPPTVDDLHLVRAGGGETDRVGVWGGRDTRNLPPRFREPSLQPKTDEEALAEILAERRKADEQLFKAAGIELPRPQVKIPPKVPPRFNPSPPLPGASAVVNATKKRRLLPYILTGLAGTGLGVAGTNAFSKPTPEETYGDPFYG